MLLTCVLGVPAVYALGTSVAAGLNASFITPRERVLGELWGALFCLCTVLLAALWSTHFVLRGQWPLLSAARWRRVALWVAGGLLPDGRRVLRGVRGADAAGRGGYAGRRAGQSGAGRRQVRPSLTGRPAPP